METKVTFMESDVCVDVFDTYMDDRQCDYSAWEIQHPTEPGWFILSIHDAEDGPACIWGQRAVPVPVAPFPRSRCRQNHPCLLYTSDAADE